MDKHPFGRPSKIGSSRPRKQRPADRRRDDPTEEYPRVPPYPFGEEPPHRAAGRDSPVG